MAGGGLTRPEKAARLLHFPAAPASSQARHIESSYKASILTVCRNERNKGPIWDGRLNPVLTLPGWS